MERKMKVLLVEDNILNQKVAMFSLNKLNLDVDIANNGLEAVDKFKVNSYDLVIMDIMMPLMDGLEATVEIRKFEKNENRVDLVPIIALTANTLDNDREKCIEHGMNEYMEKPFNITKFQMILRQMELKV
ncbi:MAG: response regulator [Bacteroidota bacterium]|nr:response regulator [Bacteroidota bacterium]MDP4204525.1 response regulator [Bacteroidota bacterium]